MNVVVGALACVWLGMVLAISFLEAPLKFGAPGVTLPIGLAIGRRVFRALNLVEVGLAVAIVIAALVGPRSSAALVAAAVAVVAIAVQLAAVRPFLARRSDRVLAGETDGPRSRAHLTYVALELVKVAGLITLAVEALR